MSSPFTMNSPGSPLSDLSSEEFHEIRSPSASPYPEGHRPSKRQRLNGGGAVSRPSALFDAASVNDDVAHAPAIPSDIDISSDTEGSVPGSPHLNLDEEEVSGMGGREQVSVCKWEGCEAGDQENMDLLVKHLHKEHIHARQKKYSCEWGGCSRKGTPHASGYALRAHMRSHTREKPFYCTLPECDRSFTRSDALAKHMRTVHETEALRPSDPVPKHHSSNPQNKSQRLRLTFNKFAAGAHSPADPEPAIVKQQLKASPAPSMTAADIEYEHHNATFTRDEDTGEWTPQFPPDVTFASEELAMPAQQLWRLLKRQLVWATEEADELKRQLAAVEKIRKSEWVAKDLVLEELIQQQTLAVFDDPEFIKRYAFGPVNEDKAVVDDGSDAVPVEEEVQQTLEEEVGDILSSMAAGNAGR